MTSLMHVTLEPHAHIKATAEDREIIPGGSISVVPVVFTDLELNEEQPGYDAGAVAELVAHIHAWQRLYGQRVVLRVRR
jgi:hypothetical protein